jgi:hypothetical protein
MIFGKKMNVFFTKHPGVKVDLNPTRTGVISIYIWLNKKRRY